jgi:hypothetical protein
MRKLVLTLAPRCGAILFRVPKKEARMKRIAEVYFSGNGMTWGRSLTWMVVICGGAAVLLLHASPRLHPPETADGASISAPSQVAWEQPQPLNLPSAENLETITVKDRTYEIRRISSEKGIPKEEIAAKGLAHFENANEALYFRGSGGGGLKSKERLIVENCTFIIDFKEGDFENWTPRRSGIFVEGFREVLIKNSVFISRGTHLDPLRKTVGCLIAYDCLNVKVEDCYFEGRTVGFRGPINIFCCGPTHIKNVEVNGGGRTTGGIWVATGVGEGKIGWVHQDDPSLMIYPPGPLLIENCWVHHQKGKENSDGIYVQSVRPALIRNCKVEKWSEDSLIDLGFRDTPPHSFAGKPLVNHGGLAVIEHCEFADGYVKTSVGLAGGLIFRQNILKNAWLFPYVFDGGSWYVVGNKFEGMTGVIVSGRNGQTNGWTPKEGMFIRGSKMFLFNNHFKNAPERILPALYVAGADPGPLRDCILADYNIYEIDPPPARWAIEAKSASAQYPDLAAWRAGLGQDVHSVLGPGSLDQYRHVTPPIQLPGGILFEMGEGKAGLTGPVGVSNEAVLKRARELSDKLAMEAATRHFTVQVETLPSDKSGMELKQENQSWAGGGAYLTLRGKTPGDVVTFHGEVPKPGRYYLTSNLVAGPAPGRFLFKVNGVALGNDFESGEKGGIRHGAVELEPGPVKLTYELATESPAKESILAVDSIAFDDADAIDAESARAAQAKAKTAATREKQKLQDAKKIKFEVADMTLASKTKGFCEAYESKGKRYLLFMPATEDDRLEYDVTLPSAGKYEAHLVFASQQDGGKVQLSLAGAPVGEAVAVGGSKKLGMVEFSSVQQRVALTFSSFQSKAKMRILSLDFLPLQAPDALK